MRRRRWRGRRGRSGLWRRGRAAGVKGGVVPPRERRWRQRWRQRRRQQQRQWRLQRLQRLQWRLRRRGGDGHRRRWLLLLLLLLQCPLWWRRRARRGSEVGRFYWRLRASPTGSARQRAGGMIRWRPTSPLANGDAPQRSLQPVLQWRWRRYKAVQSGKLPGEALITRRRPLSSHRRPRLRSSSPHPPPCPGYQPAAGEEEVQQRWRRQRRQPAGGALGGRPRKCWKA